MKIVAVHHNYFEGSSLRKVARSAIYIYIPAFCQTLYLMIIDHSIKNPHLSIRNLLGNTINLDITRLNLSHTEISLII